MFPSFRTPPIVPGNQPQIIDPRAQYERESRLAQELLARSSQYNGGGWAEALAMMLNAYGANKMGKRAEGSLSAALQQEQEREAAALARQQQEAEAAREADFDDAVRLARERARIEQEFAPPPEDPEETMRRQLALHEGKAQIDSRYRDQEPRQPSAFERTAEAIQMGVQQGRFTPEQGQALLDRAAGIDLEAIEPPEAKMSEADKKRERALQDLGSSMANYRSLLQEYGTEMFGNNAARLEAAFRDLQLKVKDAEELGVIAGPDMELINGITGSNPTDLMAQFNPRGAARRIARIEQYAANKGLDLNAAARGEGGANRQRPGNSNISPETARLLERY